MGLIVYGDVSCPKTLPYESLPDFRLGKVHELLFPWNEDGTTSNIPRVFWE